MKRLFGVLVGAMMVCTLSAQNLEKDEAAIVYYSPKTLIHVDLTYYVETHTPGIFAEYAEELLGIKDVPDTIETKIDLLEAKICTSTEADYTRPHVVRFDAGIPMLLTMNEKNLLVGYNLPKETKPTANNKQKDSKQEALKSRIPPTWTAPYPEEVAKAGNLEEQARAAANQIYRLREMRMFLLGGEVEHMPADGVAMKETLAEMEKEEQALVALFTGEKSSRIADTHRLTFCPGEGDTIDYDKYQFTHAYVDSLTSEVLEVEGTIYALKHEEKYEFEPVKDKKKAEKPVNSPIVYNLPGYGEVRVRYCGREMAKRTIHYAQAGIDVPLPMSLFTGKELPVIRFNEKTGNIKSITK